MGARKRLYHIYLEETDLGQMLDGLECRADAWEKTAHYHRTGESPPDFIVEECNDAEEASNIAAHYRLILSKIEHQMEAQR
jgi:hypothetical protein